MWVYFFLLIMVFGIGLYGSVRNKKNTCLWINLTILCIAMAARGLSVGTDVSIYENLFHRIARENSWEIIANIVTNAPVYGILNKLISYVGNLRLLLVVEAIILCYAVGRYIQDFSESYAVSVYCFVALFFYMHAFNISRQFLAVSLVLLAVCLRERKKLIPAVIVYLLAIGVHSLAFIALPLLVFTAGNMSPKVFKLSLWAAVAAGIGIRFLFEPLINLFVLIFPRYAVYLGRFAEHNVFAETSRGANFWLNVFYLLVAALAILAQYGVFRDIRIPEEKAGCFRFLTFAVFMGAVLGIAGGNNMAFSRAIYFYQIHAIALIPNCLRLFKNYRAYFLIAYLLLLILLAPMIICLQRNMGEVVPYQTMWA